jgi:hypothetical protein
VSPERVYLHIGLHKTATSYLQSKFRRNVPELGAQGVYFPYGDGQPTQHKAIDDLHGRRPRNASDERSAGAWAELVAAVNALDVPAALISDERLSLSGIRAINTVRDAFGSSQLHVIVTVRDLGRVLVSSWQETIRGGATWTWADYIDAVRDPEQHGVNPARGFWTTQDLSRICAAWEVVAPPDQLHIVTVPPSGSSMTVVLRRFCSVLGVAPRRLPHQARYANTSNDVAGTELVRRLNERLGQRLNQLQYDRAVKVMISRKLTRKAASSGVLPAGELGWVRELAEAQQKMIVERGYDVRGDLDDLLPVETEGRAPGIAEDSELLDAALTGLTAITESYAQLWWSQRPEQSVEAPMTRRFSARMRGLAFRTRNRILTAADKRPALRHLSGWAMRARTWRHERAMRVARRRRAG